MNDKIYRFLSFESFVDLIQRKQLAFVSYDSWEDPYEGFVVRAIQSEKGKKEILKHMEQHTI